MPTDCISFQNSGYFTPIMIDYLNQDKNLKTFYNRFPNIDNFKAQIAEKQKNYLQKNRIVLVESLKKQYQNFNVSNLTLSNINLLKNSNTYTVTTGHQLNLFTGPLYFLYKIISTINLCKELQNVYPEHKFVPIYWMATEDHDFEEINHFNFKGKKVVWKKESSGPVGRLSTIGLESVYTEFFKHLGLGENVNTLKKLFSKGYLEHSNLANATRYIANELFKDKGLVILDGDDKDLKQLFSPFIKDELFKNTSFNKVTQTINNFKYNVQVNPRKINLFYITDSSRERIVFENNTYAVLNTNVSFTKEEIEKEVDNFPEKFSPNVITRPLYQEFVLPNLCYIGGGGELAYWLELKSFFDAVNVTFPVLLLRNSVLLATEKQVQKADSLQLSWQDLFSNKQDLQTAKTNEFSTITFDFNSQKELLKSQFEELTKIASNTDKSFIGAVNAQEKKQLKGLENLEKRLLKAEKRVYKDKLDRIFLLQEELFPNQSLQERKVNFSEYYETFGAELLDKLFTDLKPLEQEFNIVVL